MAVSSQFPLWSLASGKSLFQTATFFNKLKTQASLAGHVAGAIWLLSSYNYKKIKINCNEKFENVEIVKLFKFLVY